MVPPGAVRCEVASPFCFNNGDAKRDGHCQLARAEIGPNTLQRQRLAWIAHQRHRHEVADTDDPT
jgi:hypothetical protein